MESRRRVGGGDAAETVDLANRKYLGSKRLLAKAILDVILADCAMPGVFLDGFAGTGAVGAEALSRGCRRVVAVDNLLSNTVILRGFAFATRSRDREDSLAARIEELNRLPGTDGYVTASFAGTYFSAANCRRMDAVRELIEQWRGSGQIDDDVRAYLLASFLLGVDRVANTVGQYDAYLKHLGSPSISEGRHLVDGRVYTPFRMLPLAPLGGAGLHAVTGDLLALAPSLSADVAYLDPPYNTRQYCDCYHVLENLARWEKPPLSGKTRKFPRDGLRSSFSRRTSVRAAFASLLESVRAPDVYLSYSSEGLLESEEMQSLLACHGTVSVHSVPYPVFGSGAGVARRREVTEFLFHLRRRRVAA